MLGVFENNDNNLSDDSLASDERQTGSTQSLLVEIDKEWCGWNY